MAVDPLDVLAYHRRKVEVFRRLDEAGVPDSVEALAEAEAELAEALRAAPAEVELVSFGYLHADAPADADLVIDMRRHFRDPHVSPELRELTAEHELVMRAVFATEGVPDLARAVLAAVAAFRSGPSAGTVRVAVGCAGGRHRSAAMVNYLAIQYGNELRVSTEHRDMHRPVVER
ncbi:ATPase [Streptomyces sp. SID7760]|nr:ATPase [Streptomyces sp. SID7760]